VIEIAWTVFPVLILLVIAIPSFKLLYFSERVPESNLTLKVTGAQWYWHYQYPDNGDFQFDSYGIEEKNLAAGQKRLLDVDNPVVLPINTNVRVQIAGQDVMHSWFIPSFGVQKYAVVGRLNETWINIEKPGTYYGECNQICGVNHAFMPIVVKAVTQQEFDAWVAEAKTKFAANGTGTPTAQLAAAPAN
jgi:cytochrome c oxidase subunit 2